MHIAILFLPVYVKSVISMLATGQKVCPQIIIRRNSSGNYTELIFNCCPDYVLLDGTCQECSAGMWGSNCLLECLPNFHGVQCKQICSCLEGQTCDPVHGCICDKGFTGPQCSNACSIGTYGVNCTAECMCSKDAQCDHVTGECVCPAGLFGDNCTKECPSGKYGINCRGICNCSDHEHCDIISGDCNSQTECHLGYYDYNLDYNCSKACICNNGALCNKISGTCECKDNTSCINIRKITFPNNTTANSINRNLLVLVVTIAVSLICVLLLALTYLTLKMYLKKRRNRGSQHDINETDSVQGPYNESYHYSEIRDDQLDNIRSSRILENDNPQSRFQQTANGEHDYQNNAQVVSNIDMFEEQHPNAYCSLQHIHDDYLNPYCALRFERPVHSCRF